MLNKVEISNDLIHSEVIWSFLNVKKELLDTYPTGQACTEILRTINGQLWQIELFPNGKDQKSNGCVDILITFLIDKEKNRKKINANCYFMIEDIINKRLKYTGHFQNKIFETNHGELDSSVQKKLLQELENESIIIKICLIEQELQQPSEEKLIKSKLEQEVPVVIEFKELSSTKSVNLDDIKTETINQQCGNNSNNLELDDLIGQAETNIKNLDANGIFNSIKTPLAIESVDVELRFNQLTNLPDKLSVLESNQSSSETCQV